MLWNKLSNVSQGNRSEPRKSIRPAPCQGMPEHLSHLSVISPGPSIHGIYQQPHTQGGQQPHWLLVTARELPVRKAGGLNCLLLDSAVRLLTWSKVCYASPCTDMWKGKLQFVTFLAQRWDYSDETSVPSRWERGQGGKAGPCLTLEAVVPPTLFSAALWVLSCYLLASLYFFAGRYF